MPSIPVYIAVISSVGLTVVTLLLVHLTYTSIGRDRRRSGESTDRTESGSPEEPATASGA